jgi:hypothetical protein
MIIAPENRIQRKIKNIQRGVIAFTASGTYYANVTISTVDTTKAELSHLGDSVVSTGTNTYAYLTLFDENTIQCHRLLNNPAQRVSWELTEWE